MNVSYWLIKSEPDVYSWTDFLRDGVAVWDGVRNYQARNNLRAMRVGDQALFYHSNIGKEIVGVAEISRAAYPDPTDESGTWACVDVRPLETLAVPVTLERIKAEAALANLSLLRQSRLSVAPVAPEEFAYIRALGGAK
jgi:predicted RNA-binding protein with PUA-like domain